jgi:hypothetical protein
MKIKAILMGMFLLVGTANVFATSNVKTKKSLKNAVKTSCTVSVKTGKYDVTITNSCDCSRKAACDGAYAVASLLL